MSAQELKSLATAGRLHPDDLVRHGREAAWVPAGRLKGLFSGSAARAGANPPAAAPPVQTDTSARVPPSPPAGPSRAGGPAPPRPLDAGGHRLPPLPEGAAGPPMAATAPEKPRESSSPISAYGQAPEKAQTAANGLDFLEEEFAAPAGFRAPRPKSSISDVLEQKRQRERRNLTILAGVAAGLMLVLGVLMTILFLKQHAAVPASSGHGTTMAPGSEAADKAQRADARASEPASSQAGAGAKELASPSNLPAASGKAAGAKAQPGPEHGPSAPSGTGVSPPPAASKPRLAERASLPARPAARDRSPASPGPVRKGPQQPKPLVKADELPPPTGDPEKDLGIGTDMPPPGKPTPWSPLPDPPRKPSAEKGKEPAAIP